MEQPKKPAGTQAFPKALGIIEGILKAGHSPEDVEATIRHGIDVWSIGGFEVSMQKAAKAKPKKSSWEVENGDRSIWDDIHD